MPAITSFSSFSFKSTLSNVFTEGRKGGGLLSSHPRWRRKKWNFVERKPRKQLGWCDSWGRGPDEWWSPYIFRTALFSPELEENQYLVFRWVNGVVSLKCPGQFTTRRAAAAFQAAQRFPGLEDWQGDDKLTCPSALGVRHCSRSWDPLLLFAFSHIHYSTAQEKAKNLFHSGILY